MDILLGKVLPLPIQIVTPAWLSSTLFYWLQKSDAGDNWFLCKVNPARRYARDPALCNPTHVLVLRTESLLQQRPHGLLEVSWGSRDWVTAIAAPRFINGYNCMAMMKNICGPVFEAE